MPIVEQPTPEQQSALAQEWLLLEQQVHDKRGTDILWSWLHRHPHFDPQTFWLQQMPDDSGTPFQALVCADPNAAHQLWDEWLGETQAQRSIFDIVSPKGRVLMHDLWSAHTQKEYSALHAALVVTAQQHTASVHWTWKDQPIQHLGDGWLQEIVAQIKSKAKPEYDAMIAQLSTAFPRAASTAITPWSDSPWSEATTEKQVRAIQSAGHNVNDRFSMGALVRPAWEWLWITVLPDNCQADMPSWGIDDPQRLEAMKATRERWTELAPNSRRATSGYVMKIMSERGVDHLGNTSLSYLLRHRSDLLPLLLEKSYRNRDLMVDWMRPNELGFTPLGAAVLYGNKDAMGPLVHALARHDIPAVMGWENTGWFKFAHDRHHLLNSQSGYYGVTRSADRLAALNWTAEQLFGPPSAQQAWAKTINSWCEQQLTPLIKPSPADTQMLGMMVGMFVRECHAWSDAVDPELMSALSFATVALVHKKEIVDHAGLGQSHRRSYVSYKYNAQQFIPTVWTAFMANHVSKANVKMTFNINVGQHVDEKSTRLLWETQARRSEMEKAVGSTPDRNSQATRKM